MRAWWALCRREWLEHRTSLYLAPLGLLVLFLLAMTFAAVKSNVLQDAPRPIPLAPTLLSLMIPFTWLYFLAAIHVLLGSLLDERKDRTILFWKSMPVTDTHSVLSKLFVVCGFGSLISVGAIICAQGAMLVLASLFATATIDGGSLSSALLLASNALNWLCGYFSLIFWLLPLWGWLLLVSSVAHKSAIFWAVAAPAAVVFVEGISFNTNYIADSIMRHLDLRALPTHIGEHSSEATLLESSARGVPAYLPQLAELWASSSMWFGIITGGLFIAGAIYFRGRNNEL